MAFHVNTLRGSKEKTRIKFDLYTGMSIPYLFILFTFVLLPFFFIVLYAFLNKSDSKLFLTLTNFSEFVSNENFLIAAGLSLWFAFLTTVFSLVIAYPVAYFIARSKAKIRSTVILLITIPMWINMLLRTLAWKQIFELFEDLLNIDILGTDFAVVFGMVYVFLPFMIIPIYTSILKIDNSLYEASKDLGANSVKTFVHVTLPLSMPGIISGITMVFLPAATSLVIPKYLGDGLSRYYLIGNLIESYFIAGDNYYFGSAIAVLLSLIILLMMYFVNKMDRTIVNESSTLSKRKKSRGESNV
jgi:spermidine/putrescine transport system permease protein